jgi:hypothetical protein
MRQPLTREGSHSLRSPLTPGSGSGAQTLASPGGSRLSMAPEAGSETPGALLP